MLVQQKSLLFGRHLCSVPYFDAAGLLADDDAARDALLAEARQLRVSCRAGHAELRQLHPLPRDIPTRTDKVTLWLNLPAGAEAMWEQLKTKVRTKIRKCQKSNLTVRDGGAELLDDFHAVYSRTMRDLGSPPHSLRFFRLITESLGQAVRLFAVYGKGCPLAASFAMTDRQGFHVPWSGSDWRHSELGANRILYWQMLSWAADAGAKRFDFGRSTRDSGTYEFKREWGAEPVPLYWHYLLPEGEKLPELRPDSGKFRLMVAAWKRLPLWAARALGPRIIGRLS
jgi:FemAB-related protein (PEP-CTERM system-associated)